MDFDDLFEEGANQEKYREPDKNTNLAVENIMRYIESEFTGEETVETSRMNERNVLRKSLTEAEKKLKSIKNPKNVKNAAKISAQNKEKRDVCRREIARCKLRLDEIDSEEGIKNKGESNVSNIKSSAWNMNPYEDM